MGEYLEDYPDAIYIRNGEPFSIAPDFSKCNDEEETLYEAPVVFDGRYIGLMRIRRDGDNSMRYKNFYTPAGPVAGIAIFDEKLGNIVLPAPQISFELDGFYPMEVKGAMRENAFVISLTYDNRKFMADVWYDDNDEDAAILVERWYEQFRDGNLSLESHAISFPNDPAVWDNVQFTIAYSPEMSKHQIRPPTIDFSNN